MLACDLQQGSIGGFRTIERDDVVDRQASFIARNPFDRIAGTCITFALDGEIEARAATLQEPLDDIRPPEAKRTPEECAKAREHIMKLAEVFDKNEGIGPPFTASMATMLARECERWMTKERYDCILKAGMPMDLMGCRP